MELFVLKLAIVAACAFALFALSRFLSKGSERHDTGLYVPDSLTSAPSWAQGSVPKVGNELPFPFDIRQLEADLEAKYGPDFFRPKILNYSFAHMDIETGPGDPDDFYDEFYVEFENPNDGYRWISSFWITTPAGLTRQMNEERTDVLWGTGTVVIRRFSLETILRAVLKRQAEAWHGDAMSEKEEDKVSSDDSGQA